MLLLCIALTKPLHRRTCLKPDFNTSINAPILPSPLWENTDALSVQVIFSYKAKINSALSYHRLLWWYFIEQAFDTSIMCIASRDIHGMREKMFTCIDSQVNWIISNREESPLPNLLHNHKPGSLTPSYSFS